MSCSIFFFKKREAKNRSPSHPSIFKCWQRIQTRRANRRPRINWAGQTGHIWASVVVLPSQSILLSGHVKSWRRSGNARKSDTPEKEGELTSEGSRVLRLPLCSPASCVGAGPFAGEFRLLCDGERVSLPHLLGCAGESDENLWSLVTPTLPTDSFR